MTKTHKVHAGPVPEVVVKPWTYSDEQREQIEILREYSKEVMLPESDEYHYWEKRWLEKADTVPRYVRAAKWKLDDAKKRLNATLEWRREFKPDLIPPDEVRIESETGKIILNGFDKDGRPVIYMRPGRENTSQSPRQLRHLVWCLERAKDLQPPGVESVAIVVDYKSTTLRTNPSIGIARKVLHILQAHYPETLGRGLVVNMPRLLAFFYNGIAPFMDPVTRDKIRFNPDLLDLIPAEQLDADFGGEFEYEFEPESYWSQITEHCGIAPDGTRVNKAEAAEGKTKPEELPSDSESSHEPTGTENMNGDGGAKASFPDPSSEPDVLPVVNGLASSLKNVQLEKQQERPRVSMEKVGVEMSA